MNELDQTERVTPSMVQAITEAMRRKGIKQADVAKALGTGKPWVSKLLGGQAKTIKFDHLDALSDLLGVALFKMHPAQELSQTAQHFAALIDSDPAVMRFVQAFENVLDKQCVRGIPFIPTQEMSRIGQEIIRVCFANEDKPGKVAKEVLRLLSAEIEKTKAP